jgi:hypothetical protein
MWRHPKYYKELRKRNKETQQELQRILDKPGRSVSNSDQTISLTLADGCNGSVRSGPGLSKKATSPKSQASSNKHKSQATSNKPQATED